MKIRVRTVKVGDTSPKVFAVPDSILGGKELTAWRDKVVSDYRRAVLETAAEIIRDSDDVMPVADYISRGRFEEAARGLTG